jgi:hypothetical protein
MFSRSPAGASEASAETKLDLAVVDLRGSEPSSITLEHRIGVQWGSEVWMVHGIEKLNSELKTQSFSNLDVFVEGGI